MSQKRELFYGLIRIHVLVHASHEPIFGLAMKAELERHGYRIGPGTLYPLLHGLEQAGLLRSRAGNQGGGRRRIYTITAAGRKALGRARTKVDELHHELHEEHPRLRMSDAKPHWVARIICSTGSETARVEVNPRWPASVNSGRRARSLRGAAIEPGRQRKGD